MVARNCVFSVRRASTWPWSCALARRRSSLLETSGNSTGASTVAAGALAARWKAPGRTSGRPAIINAAATMIAAPSAMNTQRTTAQARVGLTLRPPSETIVAPMPKASGGPVSTEMPDTNTRSIAMPTTRCQCAARGRPSSAGSTRATSSLNAAAARFGFGAGDCAEGGSGLSPLGGAGGSDSLIARTVQQRPRPAKPQPAPRPPASILTPRSA